MARKSPLGIEAIRFCVGPWNGRYSSIWRVWPGPKGDIYLGVRSLVNCFKVSLHQSGKFRAALVKSFNDRLVSMGEDAKKDRAFLKWEKGPILPNNIRHVLDIHFPLAALARPERPKDIGRKHFLTLVPHESSVGDNDSITLKVLFHLTHPEHASMRKALHLRDITPVYWMRLPNDEYVTFAFHYTKQLPIEMPSLKARAGFGVTAKFLEQKGMKVGDTLNDISVQTFHDGRPPSVVEVGNMYLRWEDEKLITLGASDPQVGNQREECIGQAEG